MWNEELVEAFRRFATEDATDEECAACEEFIVTLDIPDTDTARCLVAAGFYAGWTAAREAEDAGK